jgi:pyruvate,orthophosphate dikinase
VSRTVQTFDEGSGSPTQLGELGSGLVDLQRLELRVPAGFILTREAHRAATADGQIPADIWEEVVEALLELRERSVPRGDGLDAGRLPPVVVRSSPPAGMQGVLPSFVGIGISDERLAEAETSDAELAATLWRTRTTLLCRWAVTIHGLDEAELMLGPGDPDPVAQARLLESALRERDALPPVEPIDQLRQAITAIWRAWDAPAAQSQRDLRGISAPGTAVVIQLFVGGHDSSSGTVYTREPSTGSPEPVGSLRAGPAGGVAAERRVRLSSMRRRMSRELYRELSDAIPLLEAGWRDLCEIGFVLEAGQLWFVGIRKAMRASSAAVRVAVDLAHEGLISRDEALMRVPLSALLELQAPIAPRELSLQAPGGEVQLVPAQPDIHTAQLLDWCDERRWLTVGQSAPRGWTRLGTAQGIAEARVGRLLIDIDGLLGEGASLSASLTAATRTPASELGVHLADIPPGGDITLPPGPWTLVVHSPARSWAARLLGARPTLAAHEPLGAPSSQS